MTLLGIQHGGYTSRNISTPEEMTTRQHCLKPASFPGKRDPGNEVGVKLSIDVILSGL